MELDNGTLRMSRVLSDLDTDVVEFTQMLTAHDVDYVIVSGYVAILTGRSRGTEDVDVILEPLSEDETARLVSGLEDAGYWGMAMPLDDMYSMLASGDRIRIAEDGQMYPNFEVWFASNDVEREALSNSLSVVFDGEHIEVSSLELQIAYKLQLAQRAGSLSGKDFEDALHLYLTFGEQLNGERLEEYVRTLEVEEYYAELERV